MVEQIARLRVDVHAVADEARLVAVANEVGGVRSAVEHACRQVAAELVFERRGVDVRGGRLQVGIDPADRRGGARDAAVGVETRSRGTERRARQARERESERRRAAAALR